MLYHILLYNITLYYGRGLCLPAAAPKNRIPGRLPGAGSTNEQTIRC